LTKFGLDFNVCVEKRIVPQLGAYDQLLRKPFILNVQEVWTDEALSAYFNWARARGYNIVSHDEPGKNGLLIISSEPIVRSDFLSYSKTNWDEQAGLLRAFVKWKSTLIRDMNTHAAFSGGDKIDEAYRIQLGEVIKAMEFHSSRASIIAADLGRNPQSSGKSPSKSIEIYGPARWRWWLGLGRFTSIKKRHQIPV